MNKLIYYPTVILMLTWQITFAQNVVLNPSFEAKTTCPQFAYDRTAPLNWIFNLNSTTADYINSCAPTSGCGGSGCSNTLNNWQGSQAPHTGNGYAGIIAYKKLTNPNTEAIIGGSSEYIVQTLNTSLQQGVKYYIEFWVSLADKSQYSVKHLGMYLTSTLTEVNDYNNSTFKGLYQLTPQIPNTFPATSYYTNKTGWTKISGYFTPTNNTTKYIVISHFDKGILNNTPSYQTNSGGSTSSLTSYYYVDDVVIAPASGCPADMRSDIPYRAYTNPGPTICVNSYNNSYTAPITPGATSYTWTSASPYLFINGLSKTTTSTPTVTLQASRTGSLTMHLVANTPCGPTNSSNPIYVQVQSCMSGFSVAPNPTSDYLEVNLTTEEESKVQNLNTEIQSTGNSKTNKQENISKFNYKLYNSKQKIVAEGMSDGSTAKIETRQLPSGTYFLHIFYKDAVLQKQVIIE